MNSWPIVSKVMVKESELSLKGNILKIGPFIIVFFAVGFVMYSLGVIIDRCIVHMYVIVCFQMNTLSPDSRI